MPRPDVSDQRIPQIFEAAIGMFSSKGIDGASMAEIAGAAGVSKATIYHYFESKDSLILSLVRQLFEADRPELSRLQAADTPALAALGAYSRRLVDLLDEHRELLPVIAEVRSRTDRSTGIQELVSGYFDAYLATFAAVVQRGREQGEIPDAIDPERTAVCLVAAIEGAIVVASATGRDLGSTMQLVVSEILAGLERRG